MRVNIFYNKAVVAGATVVIVISTVMLSYLSYSYTVGRTSLVEETLLESSIELVQKSVDQIEQRIIDNDRALSESADVDAPDEWPGINQAITGGDYNVEQVWVLRLPDGKILYPHWSKEISELYSTFLRGFDLREIPLHRLIPNETNHLHKELRDDFFFASYVLKENTKGKQFLVVFQMNAAKNIALVDKYLQNLSRTYYVSIVDFENNGVYNDPVDRSVKYFYESRFPSTFYKWILQLVPRNYTEIESRARAERRANLFLIILSMMLVFSSVAIIYVARRRERQFVQLREDFISNVSHELKTPLSVIRMFSEILVTGKIKSEGARREYYGIIHNESDRMSRLIANLLDFTTLERGLRKEHFEKTNIARLVTKELEGYFKQIQEEGVRLVKRIDQSVPDTMADISALTMAFFNLLDNSVKYSGDPKHVTVGVHQHNGHIDLSVSDQGLGIPEGEHQQIFEKFYRGKNPVVQKIRGSGIGLSITKRVAEMHGGEVLVDSEPGKGSTFTLRIPIRREPLVDNQGFAQTSPYL